MLGEETLFFNQTWDEKFYTFCPKKIDKESVSIKRLYKPFNFTTSSQITKYSN